MESQPPPQSTTKPKARSLKDILAEFDSIDQLVFEPIKLEEHRNIQALLLPTFPTTSSHPFDYFALFFIHKLFETITTNINRYAAI